MRFEKLGFSQTHVSYICLAIIAVLGYGLHVTGIMLFDDDIAGRFRGITSPSALSGLVTNFDRWSMGRPFGHASNVTFQAIFSTWPEWVISSFAFIVLSVQSFVVWTISRKAGLGSTVSFFAAAVFLTTPAAVSLNLPVHSLATEWSTWFVLAAALLALRGWYVAAGAVIALQVNVYELYLTIFFLPYLFTLVKPLIDWKIDLKREAVRVAKYTGAFFVVFAAFLWVRSIKGAAGRASALEGMEPIEIVGRMFSAGWIGLGTLTDLHLNAFDWAMQHGPTYIFGFFIVVFAAFLLLRPKFGDAAVESEPDQKPERLAFVALALVAAGVVLVFMSYMIYFAQRYPPEWQTSRLANIHAGARFGLFFVAAGAAMAFSWGAGWVRERFSDVGWARQAPIVGSVFGSALIACFVTFNHAYGHQQAVQSEKKAVLIDALQLGCEFARPDDIIVVLAPPLFHLSQTDRVMTWGNAFLADTQFAGWDNRVLLVRGHNRQLLLDAVADEAPVTGARLADIVDPAFSRLAFLYPRGDVARWEVEEERLVIVDLKFERNTYASEILRAGSDTARACYRLGY